MKLEEWIATISAELTAAGFEVSTSDESCGFPLVKRPESHEETVRLLKFKTSLGADRKIYDVGMIFIPVEFRSEK